MAPRLQQNISSDNFRSQQTGVRKSPEVVTALAVLDILGFNEAKTQGPPYSIFARNATGGLQEWNFLNSSLNAKGFPLGIPMAVRIDGIKVGNGSTCVPTVQQFSKSLNEAIKSGQDITLSMQVYTFKNNGRAADLEHLKPTGKEISITIPARYLQAAKSLRKLGILSIGADRAWSREDHFGALIRELEPGSPLNLAGISEGSEVTSAVSGFLASPVPIRGSLDLLEFAASHQGKKCRLDTFNPNVASYGGRAIKHAEVRIPNGKR